jgi:hypothetical protein
VRDSVTVGSMSYSCQVTACSKRFFSLRALINHMNLQHSDNKTLGLTCGIDNCDYYFNVISTYRGHVMKRHRAHWERNLSVGIDSPNVCPPDTDDSLMDADEANDAPLEDKMAMWNTFLNTFAKHLGFFRLKMSEAYSLPISVVESICHDMQILFDAYQQHLVASVTSCMNMFNVNWKDDALMSEILSHTSLFEKCNSKFKTDYLFSKYLAEELKMNIPVTCTVSNPVITETHGASVEPQEMLQANHIDLTETSMSNCLSDSVCGEKSRKRNGIKMHYVPVLTTLQSYLQQPDVWASCNQNKVLDGNLHDFTDGVIWQKSVQKNDQFFIRLHFYSDELQLNNPLGNKKDQKICVFYFLVGNIET